MRRFYLVYSKILDASLIFVDTVGKILRKIKKIIYLICFSISGENPILCMNIRG